MEFKETRLKGVVAIMPEPHEDQRGFFMRTYDDKEFARHGLHRDWVQENHSFSRKGGTVRGLHFQFPPHAETKLIRAVTGAFFMAWVDLRKGSAAFGQWDGMTLSADNKVMLYVPAGFALGMATLIDNATLLYKMDARYVPGSEGAVRWDDPELGIEWPIENPVISEKDAKAPGFREFVATYGGLAV